MIDKESVLSIEKIKSLLNKFCRDDHKILDQKTIQKWILHSDMKQRQFGINSYTYQNTTRTSRRNANQEALKNFNRRMQSIFQRRHDCIHNCDRPKISLQKISQVATIKALEDIEFLVNRCVDHMRDEYPNYLKSCDFNPQTINRVNS